MPVLGATVGEGVPELAALLVAASFLSLVLYLLRRQSAGGATARRRMDRFVRGVAPAGAQEERRPFYERVIEPLLNALAAPLLRLTPQSVVHSARESLAHAGDPWGLGPVEFLGIRLGTGALGLFGGISVAAAGSDLADWQRVVAPILGALVGYGLPGILLSSTVRSRQRLVRRALPQTLEVLAISVEAGLAFDGAIAHVAQRFKNPLSDELRRMFLEFQMGRTRRQAMTDFAGRIGLPEVDRFVATVLAAESMGAPLSKVLQDQSLELRTAQRHRAEEAARTAPIKMMFPLVLLILPALFIVILGPTVAQVMSGIGF